MCSCSWARSIELTVLLYLSIFALSGMAYGEEIYQRKSISYIDTLWLATPEARKITSNRSKEVLDSIKRGVEMERFDYNPLPDEIVQKFAQEAKREGELTPEKAAKLLETTVIPTIVQILNENMEVRAKELISEAERNSFIVLRAKELGLASEHFEKILNSAYIYMPILTGYSHKSVIKSVLTENLKMIKRRGIEYRLGIAVIWFSLEVLDGKARVVVAKRIGEGGYGWDPKDSVAFTEAARSLEDDLRTEVQKIYDLGFRLQGQVVEYSYGKVGFNLGKKEGVRVDKKFLVYEKIEDKHGNHKLQKKGYFIARSVGDNRHNGNALSYGRPIIGTYAPGMIVEELHNSNIDLLLRVNTSSANISLQSSMTKATGISQYYVRAGFTAGNENDESYVGLYGAGIKKYYVKRHAFIIGYRYDYQKTSEIEWPGGIHLLSATAGIEVALTINHYFGLMADFRVLGGEYIKESDDLSFLNPLEFLPVIGIYIGRCF